MRLSILFSPITGHETLTQKGYRVFFSRITLEDKLGQEYEPYIFAALNSAKIMLAFGTDYDYYNAVWVKNEWSRYLKLMAKDKEKHLIPCYKNIDAYDMPKEFAYHDNCYVKKSQFGSFLHFEIVSRAQTRLNGINDVLRLVAHHAKFTHPRMNETFRNSVLNKCNDRIIISIDIK